MPILLLIIFIFSIGCSPPEDSGSQTKTPEEPIPQSKEEDVRAEDIQKLTSGEPALSEEVDEEEISVAEMLSIDDYDEMYKAFLSKRYNLVQQKFIDSINSSIDKAREIYNQKLDYPIVTFDKPALGTTSLAGGSFRVKYNSLSAIPIIDILLSGGYHLENPKEYQKHQNKMNQYIDAIAVHEVAHYVDFKINGALGDYADSHREEWCNVMHDLEANPSQPLLVEITTESRSLPDDRGSYTITKMIKEYSLPRTYCLPEAT